MGDKYYLLTEQGKEAYLGALESIGWFDLQNNNKKEIEDRIEDFEDPITYAFVLYHLWFDAEGFDEDTSYASLLDELIEVSGLEVSEKNVRYNEENQSVEITLTTPKASYSYIVNLEEFGDWVDEDFIDSFMNEEVLEGEGIRSRFFPIPPSDQTMQFVFVPEELFVKAIEHGIIPGSMDYFFGEEDE